MTTARTCIDHDDLPGAVSRYLDAHRNNDAENARASFTDTAVVIDDGKTYRGIAQIRDWLGRSASEFTYTIELTAAAKIDDLHYQAINHLEGDFPGGVVDLSFMFTLDVSGHVTSLVIEPVVRQK